MSDRELLVSVIIPAYGRTARLQKAVESAMAQTLSADAYEILVVDSSPDDANVRMVGSLRSSSLCPLQVLTKKAEGPGPSRNLGAKNARGRYLAFLDSDCQASPGWLQAGVREFADGVGIVQGRTIPEPGVRRGTLTDYIHVESESFIYETANIFYDRRAFEEAGGFPRPDRDAHLDKPLGGEDVDLAWQVKRRGWKSRFAPEALVMHEVVPIDVRRWLYNKRLFIFPRFTREYPELRRFFFARYFFDRTHAFLLLALLGLAALPLTPWTALLTVPYVVDRGSEKSRFFRGPLRVLRGLMYLPKDLIALGVLAAGSFRYRSLLL